MNDPVADPGFTEGALVVGLISSGDVALGLLAASMAAIMAAAILIAFARADRSEAIAAALGAIFSLLALAALGVGAVDTALTLMALGVGGVALLASGAALLTEPRRPPEETLRIPWGPLLVAIAIGLALIVVLMEAAPRPAAPVMSGARVGRLDAALALAALIASGLGVFALLGFGERAAPQLRSAGTDSPHPTWREDAGA